MGKFFSIKRKYTTDAESNGDVYASTPIGTVNKKKRLK